MPPLLSPRWKKLLLLLGAAILLALGLCLTAELYTVAQCRGRMHNSTAALPDRSIALVLGCAPTIRGHANTSFVTRMDAAADVWKAGKASAFLVSGDNSAHDYNEPEAMKQALMARGIPANRIICDFAGLRTLDSIVRAREIFQASHLIIISQPYHNARALAIARYNGIDAHAYNAKDSSTKRAKLRMWIRERLARPVMLLDLWVLNTSPRFLGEPEPIEETL